MVAGMAEIKFLMISNPNYHTFPVFPVLGGLFFSHLDDISRVNQIGVVDTTQVCQLWILIRIAKVGSGYVPKRVASFDDMFKQNVFRQVIVLL